jgi:hypothetical protein
MLSATRSRCILQERCGKHTVSCKKTSEIAGTWKQYSDRNLPGFSGGFLPTSRSFQQEPAENHWKKSEDIPPGILLPQNHRNYLEPAVSGPVCSTWVKIEMTTLNILCLLVSS